MSDTKTWQVGDLCRERDMPRSMNLMRILDLNPRRRGGFLDAPFYDGRAEVEVGHFMSGRVGGFCAIYRGYFPLLADIVPCPAPLPYERTPAAFQALLEAAKRLPGGVLADPDPVG